MKTDLWNPAVINRVIVPSSTKGGRTKQIDGGAESDVKYRPLWLFFL